MAATVGGWRIGSVSGVPVYLGRSWALIAVVMVALFGPSVQQTLPELGGLAYLVAGSYALLLLVSVLAHEAAHALVAQRAGYRVHRIVADFWGGHTAHDGAGGTPGGSAAVAVVGPLANAALAVLGWGLLQVLDGGVPLLLALAFTWANAVVAVFNLVPALPLDGGFLLEALVWRLTGDRHRGTLVAGWAGRGVVVLGVLWALSPLLLQGERPGLFRVLWVLLLAGFIWQGASAAVGAGRRGMAAARVQVGQVARRVGVVRPDVLLSELAWDQGGLWLTEDARGGVDGIVHPASVRRVPQEAWASTPVSAVAVRLPDGWAVPMDRRAPFEDVLAVMGSTGSGVIGLLEEDGRPWGAVLAGDLDRAGAPRPRS